MAEEDLQWRRIDRLIEATPSNLGDDDICFYYRDYIDGGYQASRSNQLVFNLKIEPHNKKQNPERWSYKEKAIKQCVNDFERFFSSFIARNSGFSICLIPVPPSKAKGDPDYDNRMVCVADSLEQIYPEVSCCDVFDVKAELEPSHLGGTRNKNTIKGSLILQGDLPKDHNVVFLLDDVITSGAHYCACKELLCEHYPDLRVAGLFWAKRKAEKYTYHIMNPNLDS